MRKLLPLLLLLPAISHATIYSSDDPQNEDMKVKWAPGIELGKAPSIHECNASIKSNCIKRVTMVDDDRRPRDKSVIAYEFVGTPFFSEITPKYLYVKNGISIQVTAHPNPEHDQYDVMSNLHHAYGMHDQLYEDKHHNLHTSWFYNHHMIDYFTHDSGTIVFEYVDSYSVVPDSELIINTARWIGKEAK